MKVLMYVDAENVTTDQLKESVAKLQEYKRSHDIIGKFYGDRSNIGTVFDICISYGMEFVDTSALSTRKKNLADMKIAADAMDDCLNIYAKSVDRVFLVSNDIDFLPIVYKLRGKGIEVDSYLCNNSNVAFSIKDLTQSLYTYGYFPLSDERYFTVTFVDLRETLPYFFSDELVERYLQLRFSKFINAIKNITDITSVCKLKRISMMELSAKEVLCCLDKYDTDAVAEILKMYFQKVFGTAPRDSIIKTFIKGVQNGSF